MNKQTLDDFGSGILKTVLIALAIAIGAILILIILKVLFVVVVYNFFVSGLQSMFGADIFMARFFSIISTFGVMVFIPWVVLFLFFGKKQKELVIALAIITVVFVPMVYLGTANVFFDRSTGKPVKFYVKTLEGFKFSSSENFDPKFGVKYRPITSQVVKECYFWEKTGKLQNISKVEPGKYFNLVTGEPIAWYVERENGQIEMYSLPGYDPKTGVLLKPVSKEVAERASQYQNSSTSESVNQESKIPEPDGALIHLFAHKHGGGFFEKDSTAIIHKEMFKAYMNAENPYLVTENSSNVGVFSPGAWPLPEWKSECTMILEKIIPLSSRYTVFGFSFHGDEENFGIRLECYLITANGERYVPISIHVEKQDEHNGRIDKLYKGENLRVVYVFDYIPLSNLFPGKFYFSDRMNNFELGYNRAITTDWSD